MYGRGNPGDCMPAFLLGATCFGVVFFTIATKESTWQTIGVCLVASLAGVAYTYYGVRLLLNK